MCVRIVFFMLITAMGTRGFGEGGLFSGLIGRHDVTVKVQSVIDDYVREVVEEANGVRVIYTGGAFDDDIRREAKRRGVELEPISMLGRGGPASLREAALEKGEDVALQLGFELWKLAGKELPLCSGVLARTGKLPERARQRGIEAAYRLGERILELYREDLLDAMPNKELKQKLLLVQWRIARLATMRAVLADHAGQIDQALKDKTLADELDNHNVSLQNLRNELDQMEALSMRVVTPRMGLRMALDKADFTHARRYAELVLKDDPGDLNANFAMGMGHYIQKQWARAEEYFRRYLTKKENAAVLNNLALVCMETGRYDEALKLANRALELLPESGEIKDTIADIKKRKAVSAGLSFAEVTVYGCSAQMGVTLPPPWNEVKGEAIDGGMVFRLPVKTQGEVDEIRRRLDDEPTLREKRGKPLTYDIVWFFDLVSDDLDVVQKMIGKFRSEGFLVRIEGKSNGVLRVSTISPKGLRARLKDVFRLEDIGKNRLALKPIPKDEPIVPRTAPLPETTGVPPVEGTGTTGILLVETSPDAPSLPEHANPAAQTMTNAVLPIMLLPPASPETNALSVAVRELDHPVSNAPLVVVQELDPPVTNAPPVISVKDMPAPPVVSGASEEDKVIIVGKNGVISRFDMAGVPQLPKLENTTMPSQIEGELSVTNETPAAPKGVIMGKGNDF